jgi:hypothetical protein
MAQRILQKNPLRYIKTGTGWEIAAQPDDRKNVPPYLIKEGYNTYPTSIKLLNDTGALVVELNNEYLISNRINQDVIDSKETNPHFTYKKNGEVSIPKMDDMGNPDGYSITPIGNTIPVIKVDIDSLLKKIEEETLPLSKAGVADVVFITEDANKLLGQINFTLSPSAVREMDEYRLYDLNLNDDIYGIEAPSIEGLDENQKIDETKLSKNLEDIDKRLQALNKDFNMIKEVYFNGKAPSGMIKDKSTGTVVDGVTTTTDMQSDPNASKSNDTNPQRIIDESKIVTPPAKSKGGLFGMLGKNRDAINSTTTAVTGLTSRLKALEK